MPQERLRQQIEEIKEQEANYDADAALAMAMFEHSEVRLPNQTDQTQPDSLGGSSLLQAKPVVPLHKSSVCVLTLQNGRVAASARGWWTLCTTRRIALP